MRLCCCFGGDGSQSRNTEPALPPHPVTIWPPSPQPPEKTEPNIVSRHDSDSSHALDLNNEFNSHQQVHPPSHAAFQPLSTEPPANTERKEKSHQDSDISHAPFDGGIEGQAYQQVNPILAAEPRSDEHRGTTMPSLSKKEPPKPNFWFQAYARCYRERETLELMEDVKTILGVDKTDARDPLSEIAEPSESDFVSLNESIMSRLRPKVDDLTNHKWKIPLRSGELDVAEVVEKFLGFITLAKDFVGSAVSTTPHGALAWSVVCFGIQFLENPIKGQKAFLEGMDATSGIMQRFLVVEKTYKVAEPALNLGDSLIELYFRILVFQARALRYLDRHRAVRILSDTFDPGRWKQRLEDIQDQEKKCNVFLNDEMRHELGKQSLSLQRQRGELEASHKQQLEAIKEIDIKLSEAIDVTLLGTLHRFAAQNAAYYSDPDEAEPLTADDSSTLSDECIKRSTVCLPHTRVELRKEIMTWAMNDSPEAAKIFWIDGMAGTGKSTLARSAAEQIKDAGYVVTSFFFDNKVADRRNLEKLIATISRQLADASNAIKSSICKILKDRQDIFSQSSQKQWDLLIKSSLEKASSLSKGLKVNAETELQRKSNQSSVFLVIDALDECSAKSRPKLLASLADMISTESIRFRVIITSRSRDFQVPLVERSIKIETCLLADRPQNEIRTDLRIFYETELRQIQRSYLARQKSRNTYEVINSTGTSWPTQYDIHRLIDKSDGLFQYAEVARMLIMGSDNVPGTPAERLDAVLDEPARGLDGIYKKVLTDSIPKSRQQTFFAHFHKIFGTLLLSFDSLSRISLSALLSDDDLSPQYITDFLASFYSVIHMPQQRDSKIMVVHLSFREFMLDDSRCKDSRFQINQYENHEHFYKRSIAIMSCSQGLRRNIADLDSPGTCVSDDFSNPSAELIGRDKIPDMRPELIYVCRFWGRHLNLSDSSQPDSGYVLSFLRQHFLHWLEALSLVGKLSDGLATVIKLRPIYVFESQELSSFLYDAERFIRSGRRIIENAPLQTYYSALLMAPKQSTIRQAFFNELPSELEIYQLPKADTWGFLRETRSFDGPWFNAYLSHSGGTCAIIYGNSFNMTIKHSLGFWDIKTGDIVYSPERPQDEQAETAAFTSDDKFFVIVRASDIELYHVASGLLHHAIDRTSPQIYERPPHIVIAPNGDHVASYSDSHCPSSIFHVWRVWESFSGRAGTLPDPLLIEEESPIEIVMFSSDSEKVAVALSSGIFTIRDAHTGATSGVLQSDIVGKYMSFLHIEGTYMVAIADYEQIEVWNTSSQEPQTRLNTNTKGEVHAIALTTDCRHLIAALGGGPILVWDLFSRTISYAIPINALVIQISTTNDLLMFTSPRTDYLNSKQVVRLWDLEAAALEVSPAVQTERVSRISLSSDCGLAAVVYAGQTVQIWDVMNEDPISVRCDQHTLQSGTSLAARFKNRIECLFFSSHPALLALVQETEVILWNFLIGETWVFGRYIFPNSNEPFTTVGHLFHAFSPDGNEMAITWYISGRWHGADPVLQWWSIGDSTEITKASLPPARNSPYREPPDRIEFCSEGRLFVVYKNGELMEILKSGKLVEVSNGPVSLANLRELPSLDGSSINDLDLLRVRQDGKYTFMFPPGFSPFSQAIGEDSVAVVDVLNRVTVVKNVSSIRRHWEAAKVEGRREPRNNKLGNLMYR